MKSFLVLLEADYPQYSFVAADLYSWSPASQTIFYPVSTLTKPTKNDIWSLLHEIGHANLRHQAYATDLELVQLEAAAWETAKEVSQQYGVTIDDDHIQDCIDTYRDWLHQRSTCPQCSTVSPQIDSGRYKCFNCSHTWLVTNERFCRPYRRSETKKHRPSTRKAMFI